MKALECLFPGIFKKLRDRSLILLSVVPRMIQVVGVGNVDEAMVLMFKVSFYKVVLIKTYGMVYPTPLHPFTFSVVERRVLAK